MDNDINTAADKLREAMLELATTWDNDPLWYIEKAQQAVTIYDADMTLPMPQDDPDIEYHPDCTYCLHDQPHTHAEHDRYLTTPPWNGMPVDSEQ